MTVTTQRWGRVGSHIGTKLLYTIEIQLFLIQNRWLQTKVSIIIPSVTLIKINYIHIFIYIYININIKGIKIVL